MTNMTNFIRGASAAVCGIAGFLFGSLDGLLMALIAFMALDYITGVVNAWITRTASSKTGFIGIARKGLILCVVAIGHIMDTRILGGGTSLCRSAVIGFYLANEGISILENAGAIGIPLPQRLLDALIQLKHKSDKEDKEE